MVHTCVYGYLTRSARRVYGTYMCVRVPILDCLARVRYILVYTGTLPEVLGRCTVHTCVHGYLTRSARHVYGTYTCVRVPYPECYAHVRYIHVCTGTLPGVLGTCTVHTCVYGYLTLSARHVYGTYMRVRVPYPKCKARVRYIHVCKCTLPGVLDTCTVHKCVYGFLTRSARHVYNT